MTKAITAAAVMMLVVAKARGDLTLTIPMAFVDAFKSVVAD